MKAYRIEVLTIRPGERVEREHGRIVSVLGRHFSEDTDTDAPLNTSLDVLVEYDAW